MTRQEILEAVKNGVSLAGKDLSGADLYEADLRGADLRYADLYGANLKGAKMPSDVKVDGLHLKMYDATKCEGALNMSKWHCGTTHCRAGWAITLAGKEGAELEAKYGAAVAGTIIYHNSVGMVPDFYCNNDKAMADIRKWAGLK